MAWNADINAHMVFLSDGEPTVIETDNTGLDFGPGFPGYLGDGSSHVAITGAAGATRSLVPVGSTGQEDLYAGVDPSSVLRTNSAGLTPNPEYGGVAGRVSRLAYDADGPATTTSVESFAMNGARIKPGRPDLARGGPVGASGDLGNFLAVALAQSTYDFPAQDLSQLNVLLGL